MVDTMTTDYQAERILFNPSSIKQRQACLKRIQPEKFPFFGARHVDTPIRPIESDRFCLPHGKWVTSKSKDFVSQHHHSEDASPSAADTLFMFRPVHASNGGLKSYLAYARAAARKTCLGQLDAHMTEEVFLCRFLYCKRRTARRLRSS